jgi:large subunit ribosomal protein L30
MTTKTSKPAPSGKIQLKWVRSAICTPVKHKRVVKGLGFTRLYEVIERPDTAAIRGMVKKIPHLVEIVN